MGTDHAFAGASLSADPTLRDRFLGEGTMPLNGCPLALLDDSNSPPHKLQCNKGT
jgi:hypothetical protein